MPDVQTRIHESKMRNKNFEDITKLIKNSPYLGIKSIEFSPPQCAIEFKDPKIAVLFALNFENYFPVAGEFIRIAYDFSYVCGIRSLAEHADHLKKRRVVFLVDEEGVPSLRDPRGVPWGTKQRSIAIEDHLKKITASAFEKGIDPEELIICYTSGWGSEDLYGALGGFSLRDKGYIVFPEEAELLNWLVEFTGDLIAIKLGTFQEKLTEEGIIEYGALLPEFELQNIFGKCTRKGKIQVEEAVAVEIESSKESASDGRRQLRGYVRAGHFNHGILICPGRSELDEKPIDKMGLITWNDKEEVFVYPEKLPYQPEKLEEVLTASKKLISLILVKNVALEELLRAYGNKSVVEILDAFIELPKIFSTEG